jgi:activator of HSP90 ATPase
MVLIDNIPGHQGHSGTLTTSLEQSFDSTQVTFSLAGVPAGLEDTIKQNIEQY